MDLLQTRFIKLPCAVYSRQKPANPFVFSHFIDNNIPKTFPTTLTAGNIKHWHAQNRNAYQLALARTPVIILVSGDVARAFCVIATPRENTPFLFYGSYYQTHPKETPALSELHEHYISLKFHSTLAYWDMQGDFQSMHVFPSCISILPKVIRETDIAEFQKNMSYCIQKCLHDSMWSCGGFSMYREDNLQIKTKRDWEKH